MERSDDDEGSSDNLSNEDPEFVEVDPTGRYGRYNEVLGKGAYKTVYKAFDELDGIEVAWNQVNIQDTLHKSGDMERLYSELHLLKMLKHENIIKFCNSWVDTHCKNVNFITEIFTSGTLRQYRKKHKHVKLKAIKHWSRQILQGLVYLHSHDPPIIHRDLKCDNIFINGNSGEVKIGDLGLAVILSQAPAAHSVIGTPEFMAPELYEEHYNELVDIYSFGMCLLEILSFEYPYSECTNAAQIYKKVTSGKRPAALNKVKDPEMRKFVEKCLASASERLHAKELLMDPFLQIEEDREVVECYQSTMLDPYDDLKDLYPAIKESPAWEDAGKAYENKLSGEGRAAKPNSIWSENHVPESPRQKVGWKRNRDFRIKVKQQDEKKVLVRFRITSSNGGVRYIQFDFDPETDTAMSVACEMVTELDLSDQDPTIIAGMIDAELVTLLPDWRLGCCLEEAVGDEKQQELVLENPEVEELRANDLDGPVTLDTADDLEVAPPDSRNEVLVYGRFEEVGCNLAGSLHTRQELDVLGSFSDFSSEHFEGGGSDLSVDASFDRLNAETIVDDRSTTQNLEGVNADKRTEPSFDLKKSEEDSVKEFLPFPASDHKLDGDVGPEDLRVLVLQQKQEIQFLHSKHNQELLDLKTHLNDGHTSILSQKSLSMQIINVSVQSSTRDLGESSEYIINEVSPNTCKEGRLQSVMNVDKLDNHGSFTTEEVPKSVKLDDKKKIETHMQPESSFMKLIAKSESQVMSSQDSAASEGCKNAKEPAHTATLCNGKIIMADKSALTTKEFGKSGGGLLSTRSGISSSEVIKSKDDLILDSTCKSGASHVPVSITEPESKGLPIPEGVKRERASLTKRESYLEFYKAGLNQKDKMLATNDVVSKSSDSKDDDLEQVRKQLLQKSIADLEAKTLEGLSQSSSSYLVKTASKSASVHNSHSQVQPH